MKKKIDNLSTENIQIHYQIIVQVIPCYYHKYVLCNYDIIKCIRKVVSHGTRARLRFTDILGYFNLAVYIIYCRYLGTYYKRFISRSPFYKSTDLIR